MARDRERSTRSCAARTDRTSHLLSVSCQNYLEEGPLTSVSFSEPEVPLQRMGSTLNSAGHSSPEWALPGQAGEAEANKGALGEDEGLRPEHSLRAAGGECVPGKEGQEPGFSHCSTVLGVPMKTRML